MFGRDWWECSADRQPAPYWAQALCRRFAPPGWRIYWKFQPSGGRNCGGLSVYGCCWQQYKSVQIYANTVEQNPETLFVVLHEIAHSLSVAREMYRGRLSAHGPAFAKAACRLYVQFPGLAAHVAKATPYKLEREAAAEAAGIILEKRPRYGSKAWRELVGPMKVG